MPQYYSIIYKYVVKDWAQGGFFQSAAYLGNPHHIPTVIIISGGKGTYMLIGYIYNPSLIDGLSPQYIITHLNSSFIMKGVETIEGLT